MQFATALHEVREAGQKATGTNIVNRLKGRQFIGMERLNRINFEVFSLCPLRVIAANSVHHVRNFCWFVTKFANVNILVSVT